MSRSDFSVLRFGDFGGFLFEEIDHGDEEHGDSGAGEGVGDGAEELDAVG